MIHVILTSDGAMFRTIQHSWHFMRNWNKDVVLTLKNEEAAHHYIREQKLDKAVPILMMERDLDAGHKPGWEPITPEEYQKIVAGVPPRQRKEFLERLVQLRNEYVKEAKLPSIVYKTAHDQLEVHLTDEPCYATQASPMVRVLRANSSQMIVGFKITGLLQCMQPSHDPSVKFMEVPLDIVEETCIRFDARRAEAAFTFNVEEERFFFWVNIHWPGLREKFPWLATMRG